MIIGRNSESPYETLKSALNSIKRVRPGYGTPKPVDIFVNIFVNSFGAVSAETMDYKVRNLGKLIRSVVTKQFFQLGTLTQQFWQGDRKVPFYEKKKFKKEHRNLARSSKLGYKALRHTVDIRSFGRTRVTDKWIRPPVLILYSFSNQL